MFSLTSRISIATKALSFVRLRTALQLKKNSPLKYLTAVFTTASINEEVFHKKTLHLKKRRVLNFTSFKMRCRLKQVQLIPACIFFLFIIIGKNIFCFFSYFFRTFFNSIGGILYSSFGSIPAVLNCIACFIPKIS